MLSDSLTDVINYNKVPQEISEFEPPVEIIFSPGKKRPYRNIFSLQSYTSKEQEKLQRLKKEIENADLDLPASFDDDELLRIIQSSKYKTAKALKELLEILELNRKIMPNGFKGLYEKSLDLLVKFM